MNHFGLSSTECNFKFALPNSRRRKLDRSFIAFTNRKFWVWTASIIEKNQMKEKVNSERESNHVSHEFRPCTLPLSYQTSYKHLTKFFHWTVHFPNLFLFICCEALLWLFDFEFPTIANQTCSLKQVNPSSCIENSQCVNLKTIAL